MPLVWEMDMNAFDLVIRGGRVVTESDDMLADVGVRAGRVVALGEGWIVAGRRSTRQGSWSCRAASIRTAILPSFPPAES